MLQTLQTLIASSPLPTVLIEPNCVVQLWNPAAEGLFGWSEAQVLGKPIPIVPDEKREEFRLVLEALVKGEIFSDVETYCCKHDGSTMSVSICATPLYNEQGNVNAIVLIFQNITEQRLTIATEAAQLGVFEWKVPEDVAIWENDGLYEIFGHTPADGTVSQRDFFEKYLHPDDAEAFTAKLSEAMQTGILRQATCRLRRRDGTTRWIELNGQLEFAADGSPLRLVGVVGDITDHKLAEAAAREADVRFRNMADSAPVLIWQTDETGAVYVNRHYLEFFAQTLDGVKGMGWVNFLHPDDAAAYIGAYQAAFERQEKYEFQCRLLRHDGKYRWLQNVGYPHYGLDNTFLGFVGCSVDITDIKQAEAMLRESEERFRNMADNAPMMVWVTDATGYCTYLSRSWYEFSGQTEATGLGFGWLNATHPDDHEASKAIFLAANERQEAFQLEYRLRRQDGQYRTCINAAKPWFGADGEFKGYIGSVIDIDERQQAEAALRQSEERYRTLFESIDEGFCIVEMLFDENDTPIDYRFLEINPVFEQQTGLRQAVGKTARQLVPDLEDHWIQIYGQVALTGEPIRFENNSEPMNRWFDVYACRTGQPEARKVAIVFKDNSDRKRAEQEREQLLARERHYANQLQGLTTAALAINSALSTEQVLQVITDRAASIIGTHQSVTIMTIDQNWTQAITAVYLSDKYAQWWDYNQKPDGSGIYACVCHLNRSIRMTQSELEAHPRWRGFGKEAENHPPLRGWLAAPLVGRDGRNIGLIQLSDKYEGEFTEADEAILVQLAQMASVAVENARLYEAEQQARAAAEASREEAQAVNRIKDEFLAVLSHELRSPLNPILGWSKLLQQGKLDAAKTKTALTTIERNAQLQAQLIDDLLDISRILRGKLSLNVMPIDLSKVISGALETVRLAAQAKSLSIQTQISPTVGWVNGDAGRLQQVVWNLLSNAVKFTPANGQITVALTQVGTNAQIQVTDTGKGIQPDFLPYVFEYFRQEDAATTRKFGGLGLGLAIARQIVELHSGWIGVESPGEGQGATFTVQLPLAHLSVQIPAPRPAKASALDLSGISILVVDDEIDSRDFVAFVLEQAGAIVTSVASGVEALQAVVASVPDLIVSDIGMPEMDGYMLLQKIRVLEQTRQVPAIALTAYAGEINQQQALGAGFQTHVTKPVEPAELVALVARLCGRKGGKGA